MRGFHCYQQYLDTVWYWSKLFYKPTSLNRNFKVCIFTAAYYLHQRGYVFTPVCVFSETRWKDAVWVCEEHTIFWCWSRLWQIQDIFFTLLNIGHFHCFLREYLMDLENKSGMFRELISTTVGAAWLNLRDCWALVVCALLTAILVVIWLLD